MRIAEILSRKPTPGVVTIRADESVRALLGVLAEHRIGACIVSPDGTELAGIVSERDVVRHLHDDETLPDRQVGEIMTSEVVTCAPDATVDDLMSLMTERRIRHLPVVEEGRLIGLVSIGDLVKHRIDELTFERDQLEAYVHQA
ncbi:MAG: CBS domain-containing protein [Nocardioides sp.]|nr:CBS domain-containing protein [Nocardioides sp.]